MSSLSSNRAVLYRELYNFFTAPTKETSRPPAASAIDLPRPLARSLVHFYSLLRVETISASDDSLADQISLAVAGWFASIWEDLQSSAPIADTAEIRSVAEPRSPEQLRKYLTSAMRRWPDKEQSWIALRRRLDLAETDLHYHALYRRFRELKRAAVHRDRNMQRERAIRLVANPLADHLNEFVPILQHRQERARQVFGTAGLWNILDSDPQDIDWNILASYRTYLDQAPGLHHLSHLIVRGTDPEGTRDVEIERDIPVTLITERDRGLGDVDGLCCGSGVTGTVLPDIGLLAFPATEDLFARKFAEGSLLRLHHRRRETVVVRSHKTVVERIRRRLPQGRVILCVDTSGSMRGTPENVARAVILGVIREGILAHRPVAVFAYTDRLQVIETSAQPENPVVQVDDAQVGDAQSTTITGSSPPVVPEPLIHRLAALLSTTLIDGTDVAPAMDRAFTLLEGAGNESSADFVIVSDTRFPRIPPRHLNHMYSLQANERARFHCLTVNEEPLHDPLNVFDYRWFYNTGPRPSFGTAEDDPAPIGLDLQAFRAF